MTTIVLPLGALTCKHDIAKSKSNCTILMGIDILPFKPELVTNAED
jgi:hypothetical protein